MSPSNPIQEKILNQVRVIHDFPKPGIAFRDITTLLHDPELCKEILEELANELRGKVDAIAGIESRGFLFGFPLALELGVPFVMIRKAGKLPADTIAHSYSLEYGDATIEVHSDAISAGDRVHIHDDLLATGGTALAAAALMNKMGAEVQGFSFLLGLDALNGVEELTSASRNIAILARC